MQSSRLTIPTLQYGMMSECFVIVANIEKRMVIHDTECPHCDQVSKNIHETHCCTLNPFSSRQMVDEPFADIHKVEGLDGIYIANRCDKNKLSLTFMTGPT